jgi:hypothetical protein
VSPVWHTISLCSENISVAHDMSRIVRMVNMKLLEGRQARLIHEALGNFVLDYLGIEGVERT